MEINMENAFILAVKHSLSPFQSSLDVVANKIEKFMFQQAQNILERPISSTLLISWFLIIIMLLTTIPILVLAGVLGIVSIILLVEGFVMGVVIALTATITASIFLVAIITVGLFSFYFIKNDLK